MYWEVQNFSQILQLNRDRKKERERERERKRKRDRERERVICYGTGLCLTGDIYCFF